jgi:hypothetical protein
LGDFKTVSVNALAILSLMGCVDITLLISWSIILILLAMWLHAWTTMILPEMPETSIHPSTATTLTLLHLSTMLSFLLKSMTAILIRLAILLLTHPSTHFANMPRTFQMSLSTTVILLEMSLHLSTPLHLPTMLSVLLKSITVVLGQLAMWIHPSTMLSFLFKSNTLTWLATSLNPLTILSFLPVSFLVPWGLTSSFYSST